MASLRLHGLGASQRVGANGGASERNGGYCLWGDVVKKSKEVGGPEKHVLIFFRSGINSLSHYLRSERE